MPHETKTAKDLPVGAEVTGQHTVWVKNRPGRNECWTSNRGEHLSDGTVDRLLSEGAMVTRIPVGPQARKEALIRAAADVIEPHIGGTFKRRERAEGNARSLADSGLLGSGSREQVVNVLQCCQEWRTAERMADDLAAAGLIKEK